MSRDASGKLTLFFLHVDGGSAALQESVRTAAAAINRSLNGSHAPIALPRTRGEPRRGEPVIEDAVVTADDVELQMDLDDTIAADKPRRSSKRAEVPRLVDGLDLGAGPLPFKEFASAHAPETNFDRALLAAHYLREQHKVMEIDIHHLFTCFSFSDWKPPGSYTQLLFDAKRRSNFLTDGSKRGWYRIQTKGENRLRELKAARA